MTMGSLVRLWYGYVYTTVSMCLEVCKWVGYYCCFDLQDEAEQLLLFIYIYHFSY